ncbi:MAG: hypothetical protein K8R90_05300 [Candidatus Cloacimonetes bacterium]|nr:hypothetical protein [Candidatus Cloacimonadota bacterium]
MRVTIPAIDRATLALLGAVGGAKLAPITQNLRVRAWDDQVELCATNLDVTVIARVAGKSASQAAFCAPAALLLNVLGMGDVEIGIDETKREGRASCGTYNVHFPLAEPDMFPLIPDIDQGNALEIAPHELRRAIACTMPFTDNPKSARVIFHGVHMKVEAGRLTTEATDGKVIARYICPVAGETEAQDVVLAQDGLKLIARIPDETDGKVSMCKLTLTPTRYVVRMGGVTIIGSMLNGRYMDVTKPLPDESKMHAYRLDRKALLAALRQVGVTINSETQRVTLTLGDDLTLETSRLEVSSSRVGSSQVVPVHEKPDGVQSLVSFNALFLRNILTAVASDEVTLKLSPGVKTAPRGVTTPAMIYSHGETNPWWLLMPLQLPK